MTTNSPNPVDGDVQALIHRLNILASRLKWHNIGCAQDVLKAVDILTTPPAQLLRPVELPDEAPNSLVALCQQMYDHKSTGTTVAHDVWQDCLEEMRLNATPQHDDSNDGYVKAFYEIAGILGIPAQPNSPKHVFETVMKPKLQALVATEQPVSDGWVKCSERMPAIELHKWRTDMPLLISCDVGVIPAYYVEVGRADGILYGFKESFRFGDNDGTKPKEDSNGFIKNVTHWMPMPAAPGGQDE